jgi:AcrR family transcriptional regulator
VAEASGTRAAIVERAVQVSSVEGLEGLTIGRLAADLQMSKSGVLGHFGTKEALQLAALESAIAMFERAVWESTADAEPGLPRLLAVCDAWIDYLAGDLFPGGCYLTAVSCEFDGRRGAVRDATVDAFSRWLRTLQSQASAAIGAGELPHASDPAAIAFQLNAIAMGTNQARQLFDQTDAPRLGRRAMRAMLGVQAG